MTELRKHTGVAERKFVSFSLAYTILWTTKLHLTLLQHDAEKIMTELKFLGEPIL